MNPKTVSNRLKRMKKVKMLLSVSAQVAYTTLGLQPVLFFIRVPHKSFNKLEALFDEHPYTRYRVRCLGHINGMYVLFAIPQGTLPLLLEFFIRLKNGSIIDYEYHIPSHGWTYSENDFAYFNVDNDNWEFEWPSWEADLEGLDSRLSLRDLPPSVLHLMDMQDLRILRELSIDARRKGVEIASKVGVPTYHLSKRLKFLHEKSVVDNYRVIIHQNASRLVTTFMFICHCSVEVTRIFAEAFSRLPFQSTLMPVQRGFFVQSMIPPLDFPILASILQNHCDRVEVLWSDYRSSMRYYFWPDSFRDGAWISTEEYMVTNVLGR